MTNQFTIIAIFFLLISSVTLFVLAFAKPKQQDDIANRLEKLKTNYAVDKKPKSEKERYDKVIKELNQVTRRVNPYAEKILNPQMEENYRKKLIKAGRYNTTVVNFISQRIISALVFPFVFGVLNFLFFDLSFNDSVLALFIIAILGYFYPLARLNSQIEERQKAVFRALPDILDLLTICLESGMGINEALNKVVEKSRPGVLRDEIEKTLKEIQLGNPRLQALRDMAKRVDLKELTSVIIAIVQAEQMGTSLSKTLKIQSEITRDIRWQKAQEMAQKAPIKIIIPVVLFIFPTIFFIIFGPLVISFLINNK